MAIVTAQDPEAPPILQWDLEGARNPVSWDMYIPDSDAQRWNLTPGVYHPVTVVALQPSMWHPNKRFDHQGAKVVFILEGARDLCAARRRRAQYHDRLAAPPLPSLARRAVIPSLALTAAALV